MDARKYVDAKTEKPTVKIDIVSDNVWPSCFIGKRYIEKAISNAKTKYPDTVFEVQWRPFFLNAKAPTEGIDRLDFYKMVFKNDMELV